MIRLARGAPGWLAEAGTGESLYHRRSNPTPR
jgi:hypothetical protein